MSIRFSTLEGDFPANNVFKTDSPLSFKCFVIRYSTTFSHLIVDGIKRGSPSVDANFRITFHGVAYFSGGLQWESANFCIASLQECVELVRAFKQYKEIPEPDIADAFTLFTVPETEPTVRILAHDAVVVFMSELNDEEKLDLLR